MNPSFHSTGSARRTRVLLVGDGSIDVMWDMIRNCCRTKRLFCALSLSRNLGQQNAILLGLCYAPGDAVVTLDAGHVVFLACSLRRHGTGENSLRMFRERFDHTMLADTIGTLCEEWWLAPGGVAAKTVARSDPHTESAFSPILLAEYLPGFGTQTPVRRKSRSPV